MGEIDSVIFDLDGTLIPLDPIIEATKETCKKFSIKGFDTEKIRENVVGKPFRHKADYIANGMGSERREEITSFYLESFRKHYSRQKAFGFVRAVMSILERKQIPVAIVTTTNRDLASDVLKRNDISPVAVIAGEDHDQTKPSGGPILLALEKLGRQADRTLVVGDSVHDIAAAKAAGCQSAGVLTGQHKRKELERAGADYVLNSVSEMLDLLD